MGSPESSNYPISDESLPYCHAADVSALQAGSITYTHTLAGQSSCFTYSATPELAQIAPVGARAVTVGVFAPSGVSAASCGLSQDLKKGTGPLISSTSTGTNFGPNGDYSATLDASAQGRPGSLGALASATSSTSTRLDGQTRAGAEAWSVFLDRFTSNAGPAGTPGFVQKTYTVSGLAQLKGRTGGMGFAFGYGVNNGPVDMIYRVGSNLG